MRSRLGVRILIALVLLGSCSLQRPSVELRIADTDVAGSREGSFCQSGGCSGACGDGPAPDAPLTRVATALPVTLHFSAGPEVTEIHGDIWQGDRLDFAAGPVESFTLTGGARQHTSTILRAGHYYVVVMIRWDRLLDRGDVSRSFLIVVVPR